MTIFVSRDGEKVGEFSSAEFQERLRTRFVLPTDHFWGEGMVEWRLVSDYYAGPAAPPDPTRNVQIPPLNIKPAGMHEGLKAALTAAVVIGLFVVFIVIGMKNDSPSSSSRGKPDARVGADRFALRVTNTGSEGWRELIVYINGTPPFTYKWEGTAPAVGKTVSIPLNEFATKDGERFDPLRRKLTEAWVGGDGYDYGQAKF
ncbi:MAG: DUF4339 domain-containing protein [Chthoniobacterales bacterium]